MIIQIKATEQFFHTPRMLSVGGPIASGGKKGGGGGGEGKLHLTRLIFCHFLISNHLKFQSFLRY